MPIFRYMVHAGAGQNPTSGGAERIVVTGTNFTWVEQKMADGADTETHLQGVAIPSTVLGSGNLTFKCTWRQLGVSVGSDIYADLKYTLVSTGPRDAVPTSLGPIAVTATGVINEEFSHSFNLNLALVAADEEVFFQVHRVGTNALDDLAADVSLVRIELMIPASDTFTFDSEWNASHPVFGVYHVWIDASGRMRIKGSAPASDTDGTIVGTQS